MAQRAPATQNNEARRLKMLTAAAELIGERGFAETRIADVARRSGASSALVIYYFGTRERLLIDALRHSELNFYDAAEKLLAEISDVRERFAMLVRLTCVPETAGDVPGAWGLWFDTWVQAFRNTEVARARIDQDARWRSLIADVVVVGREAGQVAASMTPADIDRFAVTFAALLDGLSIQVALQDPVLDADRAFDTAMEFAQGQLGWTTPGKRTSRSATTRAGTSAAGRSAPRKRSGAEPARKPTR